MPYEIFPKDTYYQIHCFQLSQDTFIRFADSVLFNIYQSYIFYYKIANNSICLLFLLCALLYNDFCLKHFSRNLIIKMLYVLWTRLTLYKYAGK